MRPGKFHLREHQRIFGKRWVFQLIAPNGEPILTSEPYNSREAAIEGIQAIRRYAPNATGPDRTTE